MLNTLVLHTNVPCLLFYNQTPLGETQQDVPITLPVEADGAHYLWALPLLGGYTPCARRLSFCSDMPTVEGFDVIAWQRDIFEVQLLLEPLPRISQTAPGVLDTHTFAFGMSATLFISEAGGVHVCVEKGGQTVYSKYVAQASTGRMEQVDCDDCALLFVFCAQTCLCLRIAEAVTCTMQLQADKFYRRKHEIVGIVSLPSVAQYELRTLHDGKTGECVSRDVGYFSRQAKQERPALVDAASYGDTQAALAFFQAVQYNLQSDIAQLAGGDLEGITLEQLQAFLGAFHTCRIAPIQTPGACIIGTLPSAAQCSATCYNVTVTLADGLQHITNIQPL